MTNGGKKDLFDGTVETRGPPRQRNPTEIRDLLDNWEECPLPGKKRKAPDPLCRVWKRRSVFWDLKYWHILENPHSLDAMHVTKNVTESLLGTLSNMPEKTKDGPKAREDLKCLKIRKSLQCDPVEDKGKGTSKQVTKNKTHCPPLASL